MYERMLDKSIRPDISQLVEWCGTSSILFSDLVRFMAMEICAQSEIRFPYGNNYGWCITFRRKKRLICDVFAECGALNVMLRLSDDSFQKAYPFLLEYTQEQIDARYPCGDGGWIHYRVTSKEHLNDIKKLFTLKWKTQV